MVGSRRVRKAGKSNARLRFSREASPAAHLNTNKAPRGACTARPGRERSSDTEDITGSRGGKLLRKQRMVVGAVLRMAGCSHPETGEHMHRAHTTCRAWTRRVAEPAAKGRELAAHLGVDSRRCPTPT